MLWVWVFSLLSSSENWSLFLYLWAQLHVCFSIFSCPYSALTVPRLIPSKCPAPRCPSRPQGRLPAYDSSRLVQVPPPWASHLSFTFRGASGSTCLVQVGKASLSRIFLKLEKLKRRAKEAPTLFWKPQLSVSRPPEDWLMVSKRWLWLGTPPTRSKAK